MPRPRVSRGGSEVFRGNSERWEGAGPRAEGGAQAPGAVLLHLCDRVRLSFVLNRDRSFETEGVSEEAD